MLKIVNLKSHQIIIEKCLKYSDGYKIKLNIIKKQPFLLHTLLLPDLFLPEIVYAHGSIHLYILLSFLSQKYVIEHIVL